MATTARQDVNVNAFKRITMSAGEVFSVLARQAGMVFTAAKGAIRLTAQKEEITGVAYMELKEPVLEELTREMYLPVNAVCYRNTTLSLRISCFLDFLSEQFATKPVL